jgi:hypothetical protein
VVAVKFPVRVICAANNENWGYFEIRPFNLYPSPSDSSPTRVEESRRKGMGIFILRGVVASQNGKLSGY